MPRNPINFIIVWHINDITTNSGLIATQLNFFQESGLSTKDNGVANPRVFYIDNDILYNVYREEKSITFNFPLYKIELLP